MEGYCQAYVSREDWLKLQQRKIIKQTKGNRVYLFTGLIECPGCGHNMAASYCGQVRKDGTYKEYHSYRCQYKEVQICDYRKTVSEMKIEEWLLKNLRTIMENEIAMVEIQRTKPRPKPKTNIPALKEKLRKLEIVYLTGNKSDEEYIQEQKELNDAIRKAQNEMPVNPENRDLSSLVDMLGKDFESIYETLNAEEKRRFWRTLVKRIKIDGNEVDSIEFN